MPILPSWDNKQVPRTEQQFRQNWMSVVVGCVCPTEKQCFCSADCDLYIRMVRRIFPECDQWVRVQPCASFSPSSSSPFSYFSSLMGSPASTLHLEPPSSPARLAASSLTTSCSPAAVEGRLGRDMSSHSSFSSSSEIRDRRWAQLRTLCSSWYS